MKKDVTYQVEILFDGTLGSDSSSPFYQSTYSNSKHSQQKKLVIMFCNLLQCYFEMFFRWYVVMNLLKGGGAHYVFPCFDKPNLKTWIELSVAHKGDFHVLTTMPLVDTTNV